MTAESKPFLGRCKQCDYAVFTTEEDIGKVNDLAGVQAGRTAMRVSGRGGVVARCTNNHRVFSLRRIEGTYSEDFKCDSRCMNAKGHKCKCSCGGLNHGRGHAVQLQSLGTAVANINEGYGITGVRVGGQSISNDELRGRREDEEDTAAERRLIAAQAKDMRYPKQHIGEIGEKVYFTGELRQKREINDSILHVFYTEVHSAPHNEFVGEAKVEWWMPASVPDPGFEMGEVYDLKAKVKRHDHHPKWGNATVVTYLEEV
jgi:hypothetical protein